jgi:hypothetical protein
MRSIHAIARSASLIASPLLAALGTIGCPGETVGPSDASSGPETVDAVALDSSSGPETVEAAAGDAGTVCTGPLVDGGFSSLSNLPVAGLCAGSGAAGYGAGLVLESRSSCQGSIVVYSATGVDCGSFWLFDATTGALQAAGGECNGYDMYWCDEAIPGFRFPSQCFPPSSGWASSWSELCPDAAANAGSDVSSGGEASTE